MNICYDLSPTNCLLALATATAETELAAHLVLCQMPAAVERVLRRTLTGTGASLRLVFSLDEAAALA